MREMVLWANSARREHQCVDADARRWQRQYDQAVEVLVCMLKALAKGPRPRVELWEPRRVAGKVAKEEVRPGPVLSPHSFLPAGGS